MDLSIVVFLAMLCVIFLFSSLLFLYENRKLEKELENLNLRTQDEIRGYRTRILELEKSPPKQLSVEAQQILHDMTAHGQSIIRISPMSPTDIFWRSPK